jgi:hydroxymethylbilane synthase
MPTALPPGLVLGAIPPRADVRDVIITRLGEAGAVPDLVGTASLRRACLARRMYPDARIEPIRGNVQTRLGRVLETGDRRCDAVILAWAGLDRIGLTARTDVMFTTLDADTWIPAVGQGALAVECRAGDASTLEALALLHHPDSARCVSAERAFLRGVEGDCRVPVGALARVGRDGRLNLRAFIGHPDGSAYLEEQADGDDAEALGVALAQRLLAAGGAALLASLR